MRVCRIPPGHVSCFSSLSIEESMERFADVVGPAKEANVRIRGYVSCVLGCPYEGRIDPSEVQRVTERLLDMGCYEVSLGDTIGVGTPSTTLNLLEVIKVRQTTYDSVLGTWECHVAMRLTFMWSVWCADQPISGSLSRHLRTSRCQHLCSTRTGYSHCGLLREWFGRLSLRCWCFWKRCH